MPDKRQYDRKAYPCFVDYFDGTGFFKDMLDNVSSGGLFLRTRRRPPIGSTVTLCFELEENPIKVNAEVVRHDPVGVGVAFRFGSLEEKNKVRKGVNEIWSVVPHDLWRALQDEIDRQTPGSP